MNALIWFFVFNLLVGVTSFDVNNRYTASYFSKQGYSQIIPMVNEEGKKDIQWFRDKMKISPKYVEQREGFFGMSWGHFFTMLFLLIFAAGVLIVFILRYRRTKEILKLIKEEAKNGNKD